MIPQPLENFFNLAVDDPLFAAEGLDLDNAIIAIDSIAITANTLQKFWQKSHRAFCFWYPFANTMHPLRFLRDFIESERRRRSFLSNPSFDSAKRLLSIYEKTARTLSADINAYCDAICALQKMENVSLENSIFYFTANSVTFGEYLSSIELLKENVAELKKDIAIRREALENPTFKISSKLHREIPIPQKNSGPDLLPAYQYMLELEEQNSPFILERYGPIFYEFSHLEGAPTVHRFNVYVLQGQNHGIKYLSASLTDKRFFLELENAPGDFAGERSKFDNRSKIIYDPLIKRGINFWHQSATSFYSVLDLGYYADLATIVELSWRRPFLNRNYLLRQKSSLIDLLLWNAWTHERVFIEMTSIQASVGSLPSPLYNFIARSYPSLYYLPFNGSVWRLDRPAKFLGSRFGSGGIYRNFEELKSVLSKEKLQKIFQGRLLRKKDWAKSQ